MLLGPLSSGSSTGGAGTSTANSTTAIVASGLVAAIYVKYNDSPPAGTTDVTVTTLGTSPSVPALTLLSIANAATDGWFFPRALEHLNSDGSALTTHTYMPLQDKVKVTIAGANDGDSVDVWLVLL